MKKKYFYCIYEIRNKIDKKRYIGYTSDFRQRRSSHKHRLRKNIHYNDHLQNAWNKYGEENFLFQVLDKIFIDNLDLTLKKEDYWINKYNCNKKKFGYNKRGATAASNLGCKWTFTEEHKRKISEACMGRIPWNKGISHIVSEEARESIRKGILKYYNDPQNREDVLRRAKKALESRKKDKNGKIIFSEEHKRKLRIVMKGRAKY